MTFYPSVMYSYSKTLFSKPLLWIVLSGIVAAFAFPQKALPVLAFVALVPLFRILGQSKKAWKTALYGWVWGVAFFSVVLPWIPEVMMEYGHLDPWTSAIVHLLLLTVLGLYPALFSGVFCFLNRYLSDWSFLLIPALWTAVEWLRTYAPMGGFPWGQIGYALTPYLGFMQSASLAGIYGPTFLAVLANVLILFRLRWARWSPGQRVLWYFLTALFLASWLFGVVLLHSLPLSLKAEKVVSVAVLQGNIAFENDLSQAREIFQGFYREQTQNAYRTGAQLVVWPESPTPFSFAIDADYAQRLRSLASEGKGFLLFNDIVLKQQEKGSEYFNAGLLIGPDGRLHGEYHKIKLVPFGEYIPYSEWLGFAEALTREVGAFTPGTSSGVMPLPFGKIGVFICFETIFPSLVRQLSIDGADLLINLSNDSWYGPTSAPWQHLQMAIVRAIENRRPLLRAANSGISTLINPWGQLQRQTPLFEKTQLSVSVPMAQGDTLFLRWGDWFPRLCVMIVAVSMVWAGWRRIHQALKCNLDK